MEKNTIKCPECGGMKAESIRGLKFRCLYCGAEFTIESKNNHYNNRIESLISVAKTALETNNGEEAYAYITKAIEICPDDSELWLLKLKALESYSRINDRLIDEARTATKIALSKGGDESKTYQHILSFVSNFLCNCAAVLTDKEEMRYLKEEFNHRYNWGTYAEKCSSRQDVKAMDTTVEPCRKLAENVVKLRDLVPDENIIRLDLTKDIVGCANAWYIYTTALEKRYSLYKYVLSKEHASEYSSILSRIRRGLPEAAIQGAPTIAYRGGCTNNVAIFLLIISIGSLLLLLR